MMVKSTQKYFEDIWKHLKQFEAILGFLPLTGIRLKNQSRYAIRGLWGPLAHEAEK